MRRRVLPIVGSFGLSVAAIFWQGNALAQDLYVTNLDQLVAEAYSTDYSIFLPFSPWDWRAYSLYGGEPWWLDCSQMSCDGLFQTPTELSAGVPAYAVVLFQNALTGETTIQPDGSTDAVASVEAPSGYQPVMTLWNGWMWNWYEQAVDQPDSWGLSAGEVPPPVITLRALLADVSNYAAYAAYESNLEAAAEAAQAAQAATASMSSGFMAMDEDDDDGGGGDPCTLTSLTQPFYVTNMVRNASGSTTITWQSCQFFRYLVWEANSLSTNTQWFPTAYVWGATNASLTSWTDTATTNNDGSTVTQRFYRVQRLLGSPIAAGSDSSVVIRSDGTLWAWGDNGGELGDGLGGVQINGDAVEAYLPYPAEVANVIPCSGQAITNAASVAAGGDDFTLVVDATGLVWAFGESDAAQLGNGVGSCTPDYSTCPDSPAPFVIAGLNNIVSVAAGHQHALALRADGKVFAWGNNSQGDAQCGCDSFCSGFLFGGELGIGNQPASCPYATNLPVLCQFPSNVVIVAIAAGDYHSVALDSGGNVWTFGDDTYGQLGNGSDICGPSNPVVSVPTMLTTISNVIAIAAGTIHTVALRADKTLWAWGDDNSGELGIPPGPSECEDDVTLPGQVVADGLSNNVVAIAAGNQFTFAVTSNGLIYACGDNTYNELGLGTNADDDYPTFTQVPGISNAVWVSAPRDNDDGAYGYHTLVMTLDQGTNHYWGFGDDSLGEVGAGVASLNETDQYGLVYVATPTNMQFCTRCQREVQLGTNGSFQAQCNGTFYLYFNDEVGYFAQNSGSFTVSFDGLPTNVNLVAYDSTGYGIGVPVGVVTNGGVYHYSASGTCSWNIFTCTNCVVDANGNGPGPSCVVNMTNAVCPTAKCYSLVGRIE